MKTVLKLLFFIMMLNVYNKGLTQSKVIAKANDKIIKANETAADAGIALDNAVQTLANAKKTFHSIAGSVSSDKNNMTIVISGISFNDPHLASLEDAIKNVKGAKKVSKRLQQSTITITLKYRFDANTLWNKIPSAVKRLFTPVEVMDKNLLLDY